MEPFGHRLAAATKARGSVCVGIDPHAALLQAWGLSDDVDGLRRFTDACVEAFAGTAGVVKPQSAFFERFGSVGIAVLEKAIVDLRAAGVLVLLDVKRGDIGSTMAAYAEAYLSSSAPMAVDAITVSPYLGVGSLDPAFDVANANGAGLFVLALTSNPEGPQFQHARVGDGRLVAQTVIDEVAQRNSDDEWGSFGVVVGATIGDVEVDFAALHGPLLVPGIGAQGGNDDDVKRLFADVLPHVLPSVSREVLKAGPDVVALRAAVSQQVDSFAFLQS